eukprot:TRINITY_DN2303_c0_g1_i2.p1 TRINITY_DN2303_c0_g1~~TRINITY_DN2303_c0_g1_i2.p1  ORF type:complete len:149 (+),score=24.78 TRINITY_DN2303_c0_g1_i2:167-613(+)
MNNERPDSEENNTQFDADIYVFNKKLFSIGVELHFAVHSKMTCSQLDWVSRYGFYEGGDGNDYRLNPRWIVATLTGEVPQGAELDAHIAVLEAKVEALGPKKELAEGVYSLDRYEDEKRDRLAVQLANARGLKTPGYVPQPVDVPQSM